MLAALAKGDRAEIDRRVALFEGHEKPEKNVGLAVAQFRDDPRAGLSEIRRLADAESNRRNVRNKTLLACWAGYFGAPDLAFSLVRDISVSEMAAVLTFHLWHPLMRDVRRLPGFKTFVGEIGLVDYWRQRGWADFCHPVGDRDFECG